MYIEVAHGEGQVRVYKGEVTLRGRKRDEFGLEDARLLSSGDLLGWCDGRRKLVTRLVYATSEMMVSHLNNCIRSRRVI